MFQILKYLFDIFNFQTVITHLILDLEQKLIKNISLLKSGIRNFKKMQIVFGMHILKGLKSLKCVFQYFLPKNLILI